MSLYNAVGVGIFAGLAIAATVRWWSRQLEAQGIWDADRWRRCEMCGGVLIRTDERSLLNHLGHHLRPATWLSTTEYIRILLRVL